MRDFIYILIVIILIIAFALFYKSYNIKRGDKSKQPSKSALEKLNRQLKKIDAKVGSKVFIRIFKREKILELWVESHNKYKLLKVYKVCKYSGRLGPKLKEGDKISPEGFYKVTKFSLNPYSNYHLSINIGYPNEYDKSYKRTGSYIMIHGKCVSTGCFAMGDDNIEEIYYLVKNALFNGQKYIDIHIFPFRLTYNNIKEYKDSRWYSFWLNLKEGYDFFEKTNKVPKISVENKRYIIKEF